MMFHNNDNNNNYYYSLYQTYERFGDVAPFVLGL